VNERSRVPALVAALLNSTAVEQHSRDRTSFAPQCAPLDSDTASGFWSGASEQWRLARQALNIPSQVPHVVAEMYNLPRTHPMVCTANFRGYTVTYAAIFKGNSEGICDNLHQRVEDHSAPVVGRTLRITFVREPLRRFVSGYSEIEYRASGSPQAPYYASCRACYDFLSQPNGTEQRAMRFVEDFMQGCVASRTCCQSTAMVGDMHVISQVGFVRSFLQQHDRIDFVGRLENLTDEWARIGETIPGWPAYDASFDSQHMQTDASSGSAAREAMDNLLTAPSSTGASPKPHRTALCRVLLPDYSCFNIPLPTDCADAIGPTEYRNSCSSELRRAITPSAALDDHAA